MIPSPLVIKARKPEAFKLRWNRRNYPPTYTSAFQACRLMLFVINPMLRNTGALGTPEVEASNHYVTLALLRLHRCVEFRFQSVPL